MSDPEPEESGKEVIEPLVAGGPIYGHPYQTTYGRTFAAVYGRTFAAIYGRTFDAIYGRPRPF